MATMGGARVLGMEKRIGSLEPGKRADMITLRLDRPHATPIYDVWSQVVYSLTGSDVQDVMVNGRVIVREQFAVGGLIVIERFRESVLPVVDVSNVDL